MGKNESEHGYCGVDEVTTLMCSRVFTWESLCEKKKGGKELRFNEWQEVGHEGGRKRTPAFRGPMAVFQMGWGWREWLIYFLPVGVGTSSSSLWNLMGNAMVMTQYIRLTPDMQSKQGALWNRVVRVFLPPVLVTQKNAKKSSVAYWLILSPRPHILSSVNMKYFHLRDYDDVHIEIRYLGRWSLFP